MRAVYVSFLLSASFVCSTAPAEEFFKRTDITKNTTQTRDGTLLQTVQMTETKNIYNTSTTTPEQRVTNYINYLEMSEFKIYVFLVLYSRYFTSLPGMITNPMTVYFSWKIRPFSTSEMHMLILGVTDLFVVITRTTINVMASLNYMWTDVSCKLLLYASNTSYVFSNWVLVSWTIERFIAVVYPLKLNIWCNLRNVKIILFIILAVCCVIVTPQLTEIFSTFSTTRKSICLFSEIYVRIYALIESLVYMYIPVLVILGCNIIIITEVKKTSQHSALYTCNRDMINRRPREQKQMTVVLVTVSLAFLFLHLPQILSKIWQAFYPNQLEMLHSNIFNYIRFTLYTTLGYIITDFQNSINFFLYCIFGSKFRALFLRTFCCLSKDRISVFISKLTTVTTKI